MTSFAVRSFGCRVNQAEAFGWVEELRRGGLRLEEDSGRGDYLLVNSCTLTKHADRDVRRFIRRAARENPNARIVVTGCLSGRAPEELRRMPGVWLVVPNRGKGGLTAGVLEAAGALGSEAAETSATAGAVEAADTIPYRARAFLKVQDGCDFHCAYCVIPGVRGKSASVAGDDVVGRVRALVEDGYREIVLAGIHLSSYGRDLEPQSSLLALLERVEAVEGLGRVRLSSLDPRFLDEPLAAHIAASPRIAPHFHLSLQSGSAMTLRAMGRASSAESYDALAAHVAANPRIAPHFHPSLQSGSAMTLRTMGRGSTPESYEALLACLWRRAPDAALGADIIVGFPGETDEEFERTREFLERSPLTYFHVFPFSPREGTPAAEMEPVDEGVKGRRAAALRDLSRAKDLAFRAGFIGRELKAVVIARKGRVGAVQDELLGEDGSTSPPELAGKAREGTFAVIGGGGAEVLTGNNISIFVPECGVARREFVTVRITGATADNSLGVVAI